MRLLKFNISLDTILAITQGKCNSQTDKTINNVAELDEANKNSLCFYENIKYKDKFNISSAGFVLVPRDLDLNEKENQILIKVDKPYLSFMTILTWYLEQEKKSFIPTISPNTDISNSAKIGHNVHIAPFAVIGNNVKIGNNSYIGSNVVIMNDVCIGENVKIYSNVTVYENCKIGNNSILHSGVVIGADGFGYTLIDGNQVKIPQVGNVVIEDDVEIGANTCIDRATIGSTIIKSNSKIDNLVQVGHNCTIEEHSILCAQVGLAGNTHIGKTVYLAGQVGVGGHLKIDDGTLIAAQSGVANSLPTGQYFGTPAISAYEQKKIIYSLKDLPTVVRYVKKLMKEN